MKPQAIAGGNGKNWLIWEQAGKPVADAASLQRYSTEMMNVISAGLYAKTATDAAMPQNRSAATMDVQRR